MGTIEGEYHKAGGEGPDLDDTTDVSCSPELPCYTATFAGNDCDHDTGWFDVVRVGVFSKRIYVCEKCSCVLDAKTMKPIT